MSTLQLRKKTENHAHKHVFVRYKTFSDGKLFDQGWQVEVGVTGVKAGLSVY
jgi:hypothetical protein